MTIARHGYESVAVHLNEHYPYYYEMMERHGIKISNDRISQDLYNLAASGDDVRNVRAALASDGSLHSAPAGLAHTLAELDRLITRLETAQTAPAH
jgi:NTE family protein